MAFTETFTDGVRVICLDQAPLNLLDLEAIKALSDAFEEHDASNPLVLTGANGVFSAGVDTRAFVSYSRSERVQLAHEITRMTARLLSVRSPVIAAIPGHAIGGGFVLPLCSDYRLVADRRDAKFALSEAAAGVPFPSGPMEIIRHELPMPLLRRMTLTSQPTTLDVLIDAQVFDEICSSKELIVRAINLATKLSAQAAFARVKQQLRGALARSVQALAERREEPGFG